MRLRKEGKIGNRKIVLKTIPDGAVLNGIYIVTLATTNLASN